ncbi:hypothetical protein RFI_03011 [Reticulomyxa filosa]|uniref:Uncharacterized protein n=1 Tax=Reticulomyxa filosa TaxID=46433 RepID=X6P7J2_RETFI|nr:hypothetical protein RFI_03011 [Reticulomyxa filosa]|eukprot:ETO34088.1 hypothetical protein RFI_03011 [Reticulomyxa filosa]
MYKQSVELKIPPYVYTTHPYLLSLYFSCPPNMQLDCPNAGNVSAMEKAISESGSIRWHAFPFNSELELFDESMLAFGIQVSHDLSTRFGVPQSNVISQRDVPGTTRNIIPHLLQNNVKAMTIGCNGGSAPPDVPKIFRWQMPNDNNSEIIMMLHPGGYGGVGYSSCIVLNNFTDALCFAIRGDNQGPGDIEFVLEIYAEVKLEFPNANVFASTYTAFINRLLQQPSVVASLPLLTEEIGDTWIHGAQGDCYKQAAFRNIQRLRNECLVNGGCDLSDTALYNFSRLLLKSGEHTWGIICGDIKHFLASGDLSGPYYNWSNPQVHALLAQNNTNMYEQRNWSIDIPVQALSLSTNAASQKLYSQIQDVLQRLQNPIIPNVSNTTEWTLVTSPENTTFSIRARADGNIYNVQFDAKTGGIKYLQNTNTGTNYASTDDILGVFLYQTMTETDFNEFVAAYSYQPTASWVHFDFGKVDLDERANVTHWYGNAELAMLFVNNAENTFVSVLNFGENSEWLRTNYGAPMVIYNVISFDNDKAPLTMEFIWSNKTSSRIPEVLYTSWKVNNCDNWVVNKLGNPIDLNHIVANGSFHLHGTTENVTCVMNGNSGQVSIYSADTALVTFKPTGMSEFTGFPTPFEKADLTQGIAFPLFNNIWGTVCHFL